MALDTTDPMTGVTMLLNRMDSHPEEFAAGNFDAPYREPPDERTRWLNLMWCVRNKVEKHAIYSAGHDNDPMPMLTYEEAKIIYDKWVELQRAAFTQEIMGILTREPERGNEACDRAVPSSYVTSPPAYLNVSSPTGRLRTSALRLMPTVEEAIASGLVDDEVEQYDGNYHERQQR